MQLSPKQKSFQLHSTTDRHFALIHFNPTLHASRPACQLDLSNQKSHLHRGNAEKAQSSAMRYSSSTMTERPYILIKPLAWASGHLWWQGPFMCNSRMRSNQQTRTTNDAPCDLHSTSTRTSLLAAPTAAVHEHECQSKTTAADETLLSDQCSQGYSAAKR